MLKNLFSKVTVFAFIGLFILYAFVLPLFIPIGQAEKLSKIFNNVALGFGALLAGAGGFRVIMKYLGNEIEKDRIEKYKKVFSTAEFGKTYDLVEWKRNKGTIYIREFRKKKLRHIGNIFTLYDLGFGSFPVKSIPHKEFLKYKLGKPFITRGKIGE